MQPLASSDATRKPDMAAIPAGAVTLGVPAFPSSSPLPHPWRAETVEVSAFALARYPVTVGEYRRFGGHYAIADELTRDPRFQDPRAPAAFVSWIDAVRYAQWLSRATGRHYRLPRDAEFEKAARGGLSGKLFPWGDEAPDGRCDYNRPQGQPLPVGSFPANGYGLHDMAGSMWCWCEECYQQVAPDPACMCYDDTRLRDTRLNAVCRGGSFKTADATVLRCAYRHEDPMEGRFDCMGFRLALDMG